MHPDLTKAYEEEKDRIEKRQDNANFSALRQYYTGTQHYSPWDSTEHEASLALFNAQEDEHHDLCLSLATAILAQNFTSIDGHFGAYNCYRTKGDVTKADFHAYVLKGLIHSITNSGDGKTSDSPFIVNSATEARATIKMLGLVMVRQESIMRNKNALEQFFAINPDTDELLEFYFDISRANVFSFKKNSQLK